MLHANLHASCPPLAFLKDVSRVNVSCLPGGSIGNEGSEGATAGFKLQKTTGLIYARLKACLHTFTFACLFQSVPDLEFLTRKEQENTFLEACLLPLLLWQY